MMMIIRLILCKFTWNLLRQEDLHAPGAKQTFANPDQYMQPQPHVPASQPIVPIPKHPEFPIPKVMRPLPPRNVPLTRSTGAHPDDRRPKAKLRFPDDRNSAAAGPRCFEAEG